MSKSNGPKVFLYVVRHFKAGELNGAQHLVIADRDPTAEELAALLNLDYDQMHDSIEAQRYDLDAIPKLPPKSGGG
jgi:hypothetical protein